MNMHMTVHHARLPIAAIGLLLLMPPLAGGATQPLPWEDLPLRFRPLIQVGSENRLANADLRDGLNGWAPQGDASVKTVEGRPCMRLGPQHEKEAATFRVSIEARPETLYALSFRYQLHADTRFKLGDEQGGLKGWLTPRFEGANTTGAVGIHLRRGGADWIDYKTYLFAGRGAEQIDLSLSFNSAHGEALLTDFDLREAKVEASEGRQIIVDGADSHAELPRHKEPSPPTRVAVFHRRNPDELFFYSAPRPEEIECPLELAATPGETVVTTLAVYTPKTLKRLRLSGSQLRAADGTLLDGELHWRVVQFQPRRSAYYGEGRTWKWVADFFWERPDGMDAPSQRTQVFWLNLDVPKDAMPGDYQGEVSVQAEDLTTITVPVRARVYPFRLIDVTESRWGLYCDSGRWAGMDSRRWERMTDHQVERELGDFKARGIDIVTAPEHGQPIWRGDTIVGWQCDALTKRAMPMIHKAGLRGPYLVGLDWLPEALAESLGISKTVMKSSPEKWPESLRVAFRDSLKAMKAEYERRGWGEAVFLGVDEPGYWKPGSAERFAWQYRTAFEAGIPTFCTSSYLPSDPLGQFLTYHCYWGGTFDGVEQAEEVARATRGAGQRPWYYATGAYSGQIGNLVRNRIASGFLFYRSGAEGIMSWTFQRPRGNPYDDFTARKVGQPCITYPDPEHPGEYLDTPQWEGMRQGWLDYRYAATLAAALADAEKTPEQDRHRCRDAAEVEKEFNALLTAIPWDGDFIESPITNTDCDAWRDQIAMLIARLQSCNQSAQGE